jgi:uroporphyrin-III C-methyltransferase/precorrin-2 dehydrogenase/sirohydrochlorin ferrochelatase
MSELLPLFLNLTGRAVVLVGGGPVATAKLRQLLAAGARVRVVAPEVSDEIAGLAAGGLPPGDRGSTITLVQRPFAPADLDGAWLAVAAATPEVNRHVADVAETQHLFVNAVDDPANASAFLSGVVRRDGVTVAISTSGDAPALTALLREALDAVLPQDLAAWVWRARAERVAWRRDGVPMEERKPRLLRALNEIYGRPDRLRNATAVRRSRAKAKGLHCDHGAAGDDSGAPGVVQDSGVVRDFSPAVPWLNGPEDSWL